MWEDFNSAPLGVHIAYYIILAIFFSALLFACFYLCLYAKKLKEKRNEYIKTLNEHDRLVIADYRTIDVTFTECFKK